MREALGITGNPVGEIMHHDLTAGGKISYYNLRIGGRIFTHIPARLVEAIEEKQHEHEGRE